jgi:aminobenzoyl-glutamate transport protein
MHANSTRAARGGILNWIERVGNLLPDPITLFAIGALAVLLGSEWAARAGWTVQNPQSEQWETAVSLLSQEGLRWVWRNLVENFTSFPPLGIVLVGMIGIGVAEKSGLIGALLKGMVIVTPSVLLTPAVIFVGVMSSMAMDAGYIVLPPLACAVFARAGRAPLAGLGAVFAGIGAGFSANLLITGLDPLLQSFTQEAARILDPDYIVDIRCNYYFMIASTVMITFVGWAVSAWLVEPRFGQADIADQIAAVERSQQTRRQQLQKEQTAGQSVGEASNERFSSLELRGVVAAAVTLAAVSAGIMALIWHPQGALHGVVEPRPGWEVAVWVTVIVPILFVLFLTPGLAYGIATGSIRSDRDVARMMNETMSSMGSYIILAFFAAQFISWFTHSNLGTLFALQGVLFLQSLQMPYWLLVVAIVLLTAVLNLFIGSASAKWALISTVFVPIFAGVGISPELTQAAYRVGDSFTNIIAPLNPYIVIVLVFMQRYQPKAGIGSLISLMLPYSLVFGVCWILLLLLWMISGLPLGPGHSSMFLS